MNSEAWNLPGFNQALDESLIALSHQFPKQLIRTIQAEYDTQVAEFGEDSANTYLIQKAKGLTFRTFDVSQGDNALRDKTGSVTARFQRLHSACLEHNLSAEKTYEVLSSYCQRLDIEPPKLTKKITHKSAILRMIDKPWLKKNLHVVHLRQAEAFQIRMGAVHKHASLYVSNTALSNRREQRKNNLEMLEATPMVNDEGQEYSLKELMLLGLANPRNRYCEMMARIAGTEQNARHNEYQAMFVTITCPSRMHARFQKTGKANPKYANTTPREAHHYLCNLWECIRSKLKRDGLSFSGVRVVEPQHDGTPHWHLLLFCQPQDKEAIQSIIQDYALKDSPSEKGAKKHRCTFEQIDYNRGTATGYIAKYLSKNITGEHIETDTYGNDAQDTVERVEAWASLWGIRQFQFFGGPPASLWRELRRVKTAPEGIIEDIRKAADSGDYQSYIELCGGSGVKRTDLPLRLEKVWSDEPGRYGEPKGYKVIGVTDGQIVLVTRIYSWKVKGSEARKPEESRRLSGASSPLGVL